MGFFIKKSVRKVLERRGVAGSYAVLAICMLLVAVNIIGFMTLPRMLSPMAVILSNVITMLITAMAFKPVGNLLQDSLLSRQRELSEKMEKERQMQQELDRLSDRNHELESKLDTRLQTDGAQGELNFTFKLEQMEYSKQGYVVKEEELETLLAGGRFQGLIPGKSLLPKLLESIKLKNLDKRKILYIKKFYYKVSIGIDFTRIKFAFVDGSLLFSGVKFTRLHDITSELDRDEKDIGHTWILNTSDDRTSLVQSSGYDKFKEYYARLQEAGTREALEEEADQICRQYTRVFRDSIKERFPLVDFVDGIEDSDSSWYALKDAGRNPRVMAVASSMLMLTDVINRTRELP